jgi:uncharacterized protein (UPF0548 family)
VFKLRRPTAAEIEEQIAAARHAAVDGPRLLALPHDYYIQNCDPGYADDDSRSLLGEGKVVFEAAKRAFAHWAPFDLGWVRVANPEAVIAIGQVVAVEVRALALWTLNLSRIVEIIDTDNFFGFIYSTTEFHVERGEERFLIEFDRATGDVWYGIEAISRPRHLLARLALPVTRAFQHRFARDSHRRMQKEIVGH